jgi:hypothetical protein
MSVRVPASYWWYIAGTALLVALSLVPSTVHTTYTWPGAAIEVLLLVFLAYGSNLSRLLLIGLGAAAAVGPLALQSGAVDPVATSWSVVALAVTGLLLLPSMRQLTHSH